MLIMPFCNDQMVVRTIRHAPNDLGKQQIIAGSLDPPLNAEGEDMISVLKAGGHMSEFEILVTSPLQRARDTAQRLTGVADEDMIITPLCAERNYGQLEGVLPDRIGEIEPKTLYVSIGGIDHSLNPPGGETLEELRARAGSFHQFLAAFQGHRVLVVSHSAFLQQYHGLLRGLDTYQALKFDVTYLEINEFRLTNNQLSSHVLIHRPEISYDNW